MKISNPLTKNEILIIIDLLEKAMYTRPDLKVNELETIKTRLKKYSRFCKKSIRR